MRALSSFLRSSRGNTAIVFALCALPLTAMAGFGIDYATASSARTDLQDAVDAAALAGAGELDNADDAVAAARRYMAGNIENRYGLATDYSADVSQGQINVTASQGCCQANEIRGRSLTWGTIEGWKFDREFRDGAAPVVRQRAARILEIALS